MMTQLSLVLSRAKILGRVLCPEGQLAVVIKLICEYWTVVIQRGL